MSLSDPVKPNTFANGVTETIDATEVNANFDTIYAAVVASNAVVNTYTAVDVLTKIKTVGGTGSGLDADLLDGAEATAFVTHALATATSDFLVGNTGGGTFVKKTLAETKTILGVANLANLPVGTAIGFAYATSNTATAITAVCPIDNTIPTTSETDLIVSKAYTPQASNSLLVIDFVGFLEGDAQANTTYAVIGIFAGSTCVYTQAVQVGDPSARQLVGRHVIQLASASEVTYSVRVGTNDPTITMNALDFGGSVQHAFSTTALSTLTITEIKQ